jgi:hypothetical protein
VPARTKDLDTQNISEKMFEEYLRSVKIAEWDYEKEIPGTTKKPDYSLLVGGREHLFDVKEFRPEPTDPPLGSGAKRIPYEPVRQKIDEAREQFKGLKGYPCSLVLANLGKQGIMLVDWIIYGAMFGDVGIKMPFDPKTGMFSYNESGTAFGRSGKMVRYAEGNPIAPQNTTINAVLVLRHLGVGSRRLNLYYDRKEKELGRKLTWQELHDESVAARGAERDASLLALSVVVHENPAARVPLTRELPLGPFDERYGLDDKGALRRVLVGAELERLEAAEREGGGSSQDPLGLRKA